jgi:hypothetical protein
MEILVRAGQERLGAIARDLRASGWDATLYVVALDEYDLVVELRVRIKLDRVPIEPIEEAT